MPVPKSLKLSEAELPSFAQLEHQLTAAASPKLSIHDLLRSRSTEDDPLSGDAGDQRRSER